MSNRNKPRTRSAKSTNSLATDTTPSTTASPQATVEPVAQTEADPVQDLADAVSRKLAEQIGDILDIVEELTVRVKRLEGTEQIDQDLAEEADDLANALAAAPTEMNCPTPDCTANLWQGTPPNPGEFPLHCPECLNDIAIEDVLATTSGG